MKKFYLTKAGLSKIKNEYEELKKLKAFKVKGESPRIFHSEEIDPEFLVFQEDMDLLDRRITELEQVLENNEQIKLPPKEKQNIVDIGATINIEIDKDKDQLTILGTLEADPSLGIISNECPVGKNLIGRRVGEEVMVSTNPKIVYKIKSISYKI